MLRMSDTEKGSDNWNNIDNFNYHRHIYSNIIVWYRWFHTAFIRLWRVHQRNHRRSILGEHSLTFRSWGNCSDLCFREHSNLANSSGLNICWTLSQCPASPLGNYAGHVKRTIRLYSPQDEFYTSRILSVGMKARMEVSLHHFPNGLHRF